MSKSTSRPMPTVVDKDKFCGSATPANVHILETVTRELGMHGVGHLTEEHEVPIAPDAIPKKSDYFINLMCYFDDDDAPMLGENGIPLPLNDAHVMATFGLHEDADGEVVPDAAAGVIPAQGHRYGDTVAERRAYYGDYDRDQKSDTVVYDRYKAQQQTGFAILDTFCTETGRDVYKEFIPSSRSPGDLLGAIDAIKTLVDSIKGAGSVSTMKIYRNMKMPHELSIADIRSQMMKLESIMRIQGDEVNLATKYDVFKTCLQQWEDPESKPYTLEFNNLARGEPTFDQVVTAVKKLESRLLSECGHGSGKARRVAPSGDRGQRFDRVERVYVKPAAGRGSGRSDAFSMMLDNSASTLAAMMVTPSTPCSGCKQLGHSIKSCPLYRYCGTCDWHHRIGTPCDNGMAKAQWTSAREAKRVQSNVAGGGVDRGRGGRGRGHR